MVGMHLEFFDEAADALDIYEQTDPELFDAFDEVLELLEKDDANMPGHYRLRRKYLRPPGAFSVEVFPKGPRREHHYYLFWVPEKNQTVAFIRHCGPANVEI